ncbi:hypothetical protein THAOC_01500 [Thalassiosira oceanica]|uniref:Uncharacterized protein n=1 Tax=Thalassiosira oceanica TaxID=159749 RepID=K0TQV8_THAOC|nr:hypothetical protein THAOC_01500 [Thalassiosira oceanica]|eukprot:EJK76722.1 hypothetical protein THAOC_01500 [Thalassiosira oceanica]
MIRLVTLLSACEVGWRRLCARGSSSAPAGFGYGSRLPAERVGDGGRARDADAVPHDVALFPLASPLDGNKELHASLCSVCSSALVRPTRSSALGVAFVFVPVHREADFPHKLRSCGRVFRTCTLFMKNYVSVSFSFLATVWTGLMAWASGTSTDGWARLEGREQLGKLKAKREAKAIMTWKAERAKREAKAIMKLAGRDKSQWCNLHVRSDSARNCLCAWRNELLIVLRSSGHPQSWSERTEWLFAHRVASWCRDDYAVL